MDPDSPSAKHFADLAQRYTQVVAALTCLVPNAHLSNDKLAESIAPEVKSGTVAHLERIGFTCVDQAGCKEYRTTIGDTDISVTSWSDSPGYSMDLVSGDEFDVQAISLLTDAPEAVVVGLAASLAAAMREDLKNATHDE
ncbi:hypothetical protein LEM8419_03582 [Neolewinella maritima]|uniref:GSKIP domain-containing protein n=2 Tax=Neolewinella maritima TaxID=1383882 RepID=A0ABM9B6T1_9BACT|nr:hypothetical protein LEM8419_03582 [Neolewinella maritima]